MMFKGVGIFYLLFFTISIVLAIFPFLDSAFTSIFYRGNNQFVVQHYLVSIFHFYEFIIRDLFMPLIVVVILFLPIILKFSNFLKNRLNMFDLKIDEIIYVWMSALSVVIVVNSLKTFQKPKYRQDFSGSSVLKITRFRWPFPKTPILSKRREWKCPTNTLEIAFS